MRRTNRWDAMFSPSFDGVNSIRSQILANKIMNPEVYTCFRPPALTLKNSFTLFIEEGRENIQPNSKRGLEC